MDYREQAIKDVAEAFGESASCIQQIIDSDPENDFAEEESYFRYAVAQHESVLKLRAELEILVGKCRLHGGPKGGKMDLSQARRVLEETK